MFLLHLNTPVKNICVTLSKWGHFKKCGYCIKILVKNICFTLSKWGSFTKCFYCIETLGKNICVTFSKWGSFTKFSYFVLKRQWSVKNIFVTLSKQGPRKDVNWYCIKKMNENASDIILMTWSLSPLTHTSMSILICSIQHWRTATIAEEISSTTSKK